MFFTYYEAIEQRNPSPLKKTKKEKRETFAEEEGDDGFPFHDDDVGVPILLWLQGGPGCSGMIGNFYELGPWRVDEDQCLRRNPAPWNRIFGLLFLDNPVGAGFSIAPSVDDIPSDQDHIARDVYSALEGFYSQFPALRNRPFYVTGESYAGKYVPSVATYILRKQEEQRISCISQLSSSPLLRLDGVAIGNGLTHPIAQVPLNAPTAYFMGLIDEHQSATADMLAAKTVALIEEENWADAHDARTELLDYIQNVTGLATLLDVRRTVDYYTTENGVDYLTAFMNKEEVQRSLLNAESLKWEPCSSIVGKRMGSDVPKSTMHMVEVLLNQSIPVLLYQGQFDLQDGVASSEAWIRLLQWEGIKSFYASDRKVWKENNVVAGYVRSYSSLTHVVISNAGHLVPADQEYHSQRMIEGWVSGEGIA